MSAVDETWMAEPNLDDIDIGQVLQTLADPVRLQIVRRLAGVHESTCTALEMPVKVSTVSHHIRILRESGLVSTRLDGSARPSRLRRGDFERRFPGLLDAILHAPPANSRPSHEG
ncbi:ArsR/SmtB family transcription factor [Streptomyces sp. NPDC056149]|uniref:ArsR/SmtB family transcription factor n=1 Tax=Streptomyces sp. NPDC056149 TaxID=3345728 RepID=UPI0035DCF620